MNMYLLKKRCMQFLYSIIANTINLIFNPFNIMLIFTPIVNLLLQFVVQIILILNCGIFWCDKVMFTIGVS